MTSTSQTLNESSKKWDTVIGTHLCPASPEMTEKSQWFVFFSEILIFFSMSLSSFIHLYITFLHQLPLTSVTLNVSR